MKEYIVKNEEQFKRVIEAILKKDKGAYINYTGYAGYLTKFPLTIKSNVKITIV